jgi:hypothetical protein
MTNLRIKLNETLKNTIYFFLTQNKQKLLNFIQLLNTFFAEQSLKNLDLSSEKSFLTFYLIFLNTNHEIYK